MQSIKDLGRDAYRRGIRRTGEDRRLMELLNRSSNDGHAALKRMWWEGWFEARYQDLSTKITTCDDEA